MSKLFNSVLKSKIKPFEIRSKVGSRKAEIIIYDQIGEDYFGGGISSKAFSEELKNLDSSVDEITVRINSPGGDVFCGVSIYNRLKQHKAKIIVHIDGLAASIASIIALAGDEIHMGHGALYMLHLPHCVAMGNRNEIENVVNRLMDVEEQLLSIYHRKSGIDKSELRAMLEKETWLDADQSKAMGFVDYVDEDAMPIAASAMEKSWIHRAPKTFNSDTAAIKSELNKQIEKIQKTLARK